jgi:hypothetical protein
MWKLDRRARNSIGASARHTYSSKMDHLRQLKADIHAGIEQAYRGEAIRLEDSLARARAAVLKIADE